MDEAGADPNTVPRAVAPPPLAARISQPAKASLVMLGVVAGLMVVITVVGWLISGRIGPGALPMAAAFGCLIIGNLRARGTNVAVFGIQRSLRRQLRGTDPIRDGDVPVLRQINDQDTLAARAVPWQALGMALLSVHIWLSAATIGRDAAGAALEMAFRVFAVVILAVMIPLLGFYRWRARRGRRVLADHDRGTPLES